METARQIVENRTNALGVTENVIQLAGERRIVGEFPGAEDTDAILDIIQQTGMLEFVDTGDFRPEEGSILQTDFATDTTAQPTPQPTAESTPQANPEATTTPPM
jgi:preprotein translocase subunit SecD